MGDLQTLGVLKLANLGLFGNRFEKIAGLLISVLEGDFFFFFQVREGRKAMNESRKRKSEKELGTDLERICGAFFSPMHVP